MFRTLLLLLPLLPAALFAPATAQDLAQAGREVVERSNAFRRANGLLPLAADPTLAATAQAFAAFMARTDRYGHEADGSEPAQRAQAGGYAHCMIAENIAYRFSSGGFETGELAQGFVEGWVASPGHRRNLLEADAVDTGVAIARGARSGRFYAVQMFGRPASLRLRFEIENRSGTAVAYRLDGQAFRLASGVTRTHEQCRAPQLQAELPGSPRPAPSTPVDGARYRIESVAGRLRLVER